MDNCEALLAKTAMEIALANALLNEGERVCVKARQLLQSHGLDVWCARYTNPVLFAHSQDTEESPQASPSLQIRRYMARSMV
jgi:hypothetical protein